jgi:hypothetical protein
MGSLAAKLSMPFTDFLKAEVEELYFPHYAQHFERGGGIDWGQGLCMDGTPWMGTRSSRQAGAALHGSCLPDFVTQSSGRNVPRPTLYMHSTLEGWVCSSGNICSSCHIKYITKCICCERIHPWIGMD